ncbi:MAG: HD-GYP domain-containing protein [Bacillota bacterium]
MRILPTQLVKPGMRLGRSIFDPSGRLVIAAGITLHQRLLDLLIRQGYSAVYIADAFGDVDLPELVSLETRQEVTRCITDLMREEAMAAQRLSLQAPFAEVHRPGQVMMAKHRHEMTLRVAKAAELLVNEVMSKPEVLIGLVDIKSLHDYSFAHSVQVALNCLVVGKMLGLKPNELKELGAGALLHDIGKTAVSAQIWGKEGDLTPEEFERVQTHPEAGFEILRKTELGLLTAHVAYQHHERWDGSGYPRGLKEREVLKYARICAVCDVFDAMTSDRPYKKATHPFNGLAFVLENSGILFDPEVTQAFSKVVAPFPVATGVKLSTGETAIVKKLNPRALDRPVVVAVKAADGRFYTTPRTINLLAEINVRIVSYLDWYAASLETEILSASGLASDIVQ